MAFKVEIIEKLGILGERKSNKTELRIVSWNGGAPKYDIRGWYTRYDGEEGCTKGISFTEEEAKRILRIIETIDLSDKTLRQFGIIPQDGKYEIVIQLTKYGYDIRSYTGNYGVKGYSLTEKELEKLIQILNERFGDEPINAPKEEESEEIDEAEDAEEEEDDEDEGDEDEEEIEDYKTIHSLTSIPVNDGNYPLQKATADQLRKAISIMEKKPKGNKVRLDRCKAKLKSLEKSGKATAKPAQKKSETVKKPTTTTSTATTSPNIQAIKDKATGTKADIIQFPIEDKTQITKLKPTGENHSYAEVEAKLNKEREMFKADGDSDYVIDGILAACKKDQELLDNVMRPDKSYLGAYLYFANKAKDGYGIKVKVTGGYGIIMDKDVALKYCIDYFNSEEKKSEPKKPEVKATTAKTVTKTTAKTAKKTAPKNRSAWKKGGKRR